MKKITLAILGHETRGKEVFELLESLGGINREYGFAYHLDYYFISRNNEIEKDSMFYINIKERHPDMTFRCYTLEEFIKIYPYRIGDKVKVANSDDIWNVVGLKWIDSQGVIYFVVSNGEEQKEVEKGRLKPYRTLEQYRTHEDCCRLLGLYHGRHLCFHEGERTRHVYPSGNTLKDTEHKQLRLLNYFKKLLDCRNAYWKMHGNWNPDWRNPYEEYYTIIIQTGEVVKDFNRYSNRILVFPTEGMRDAFYENFKDLVEQCKELL